MKTSFLSVLLLCTLAITTQAQIKSISVQNNSAYTVSIILHGDPTGFCGTPYLSNTFALPPGATISYPDPGAVPGGMGGLTAADYFTAVQVFGDAFCAGPSSIVYKCTGGNNYFVPSPTITTYVPPLCNVVTLNNITWTNVTPNFARVTIN